MRLAAYSLILIPVVLISLRILAGNEPDPGLISGLSHNITHRYEVLGGQDYEIESYLPAPDSRQSLSGDTRYSVAPHQTLSRDHGNRKVLWRGSSEAVTSIALHYSARTQAVSYRIHGGLADIQALPSEFDRYLRPTATIQSRHPSVSSAVAARALNDEPARLRDVVEGLFRYVADLPSVKNGSASDAVSCIERGVCTEEGKSRLLTALFRAAGIPARVAGGLVMTETHKSDMDLWVQAFLGDAWVTFDPERDHFAEIPRTHLEIFRGEDSLITPASRGGVDVHYEIETDRHNAYEAYAAFDIWSLIDGNTLPSRSAIVLLLLPLGAYLVALCTNVVGMTTYGVFLPVLIAFAFMEMGMGQGLIFFTVMIGLISLMSFPLERWGILHVPKIVYLLTAVGLYCLAAVKLFHVTGWVAPSTTLTVPIIILTLISESFARKVEEESLGEALSIYVQTMIVTAVCFWVLSAIVVQHFFITFPEALLGIAGLSLLLGKWIGLRVLEYARFHKLDKDVSFVN